MRPGIQAGTAFPNYDLSAHTGTKRRLSDLQGIDPMILVLSRGHYCPKDRRQLRHLVEFYPELKVGYARIVTISMDNLLQTNEFRDGLGAQWPFLSDPGRKVQKDLDIAEYTDPDHNSPARPRRAKTRPFPRPMIPYTLVLEPGLKIFQIYNGYWYWGRPTLEELRHDLREITRHIRPDWDITTPELREAWRRDDRRAELFYPYGKTMARRTNNSRTPRHHHHENRRQENRYRQASLVQWMGSL